jgi:Fe-S-cluster containining protein
MDHDSLVEDWRRNAERNDDRNFAFLRRLKFEDDNGPTDKLAAELHEEAFRIIDCTRCANCCKTMNVFLTQEDVERIAQNLDIPTEEVIATYLMPSGDDEPSPTPYEMKCKPCPFLGGDDRCMIYESRPACCREFPHTDKEGFAARTYGHSANALICPAVFWIVEQMRRPGRR